MLPRVQFRRDALFIIYYNIICMYIILIAYIDPVEFPVQLQ